MPNTGNYPELRAETFVSLIPDHLLAGASDQDKFIMEQLSVQGQQNRWLIGAMLDTNFHVRKTNGRLQEVEEWRAEMVTWRAALVARLKSNWKWVCAIATAAATIIGLVIQAIK